MGRLSRKGQKRNNNRQPTLSRWYRRFMPGNIVYESVHCVHGWLTDQSEGCLIQIHILAEARIIQSIKGRGDHSNDDLVVSEQILNFTALVENGENG